MTVSLFSLKNCKEQNVFVVVNKDIFGLLLMNGITKLPLEIVDHITTYIILKQEKTLELIRHSLLVFIEGKGQRTCLLRSQNKNWQNQYL